MKEKLSFSCQTTFIENLNKNRVQKSCFFSSEIINNQNKTKIIKIKIFPHFKTNIIYFDRLHQFYPVNYSPLLMVLDHLRFQIDLFFDFRESIHRQPIQYPLEPVRII